MDGSPSAIITGGFGNGTFEGSPSWIITGGFGIGAAPEAPEVFPGDTWIEACRSITLIVGRSNMAGTWIKRTGEERTYAFDFGRQPELLAGDTIASVTSVTAARTSGDGTLTVGSGSVNDDEDGVNVAISGGNHDDRYRITCIAVTTGGSILEAIAPMHVTNQSAGSVQ